MENQKNDYNCRMAPTKQEMSLEHWEETVVELSNGDVTSSSGRPLATEIYKPPSSTNEKSK
jgi:hypothetical protein